MPTKDQEPRRTPGRRRVRKLTELPVAEATAPKPAAVERRVVEGGGFLRGGGVRHHDVTVFLRQLILLLEAGTPILKSLQTLSRRGERASVRALVGDIAEYVEGGNPLWQAFDRHPRHFDTVFVNLIKASEASGTLVPVLKRVASYREEREILRKRVRGAMAYPVILVFACFGVLLLLTKFTIPQFEAMFEQQQAKLPAFTQAFLGAATWFSNWWWLLVIAAVLVAVVYRAWYVRNPLRRMTADYLKLRLPVLGPIIHKNAIVEFTRTMALLLKSGLPMMATLELTRNAIHNSAVANSLQRIRDSVEQGGGLEEPMRASSKVIPSVVTDMFVTGEESGRVDEVAEQIAETFDEEVRIAVNTLGELLQPILTLIIGFVVIALFIALFLPIIFMVSEASGGGA
ncbi:MAG: type II secretion system F family protein [Candidatus Hydrogenedentes bacterium]|nr:type II secretion system F family protein [Candidatus Hydrogenedentota bacterium]